MASSLNFLAMPLEIRYQIYSHLLIHTYVVNLSAHRMVNPLRNGVVRACRQTLYEMTEYYYANNTFLLTQQSPPEIAPAILQRRLSGVQHLQVEIGDLTLSPTKRAFFLSSHMQQRCDWFLKNLRLAKGGQEGRFLKTLVAIDRCGTSIVSETIPPTAQIWKDQKWREEKRREVLVKVLRPLCHDIDKITVESRAMSEERNQWGGLTKTWNIVLSVGQVRTLA